jgi:hypothetical protein
MRTIALMLLVAGLTVVLAPSSSHALVGAELKAIHGGEEDPNNYACTKSVACSIIESPTTAGGASMCRRCNGTANVLLCEEDPGANCTPDAGTAVPCGMVQICGWRPVIFVNPGPPITMTQFQVCDLNNCATSQTPCAYKNCGP